MILPATPWALGRIWLHSHNLSDVTAFKHCQNYKLSKTILRHGRMHRSFQWSLNVWGLLVIVIMVVEQRSASFLNHDWNYGLWTWMDMGQNGININRPNILIQTLMRKPKNVSRHHRNLLRLLFLYRPLSFLTPCSCIAAVKKSKATNDEWLQFSSPPSMPSHFLSMLSAVERYWCVRHQCLLKILEGLHSSPRVAHVFDWNLLTLRLYFTTLDRFKV